LLESGAYKALDSVIEKLKDEKAVSKSKQFPFRFYSAYREISNLPPHRYKKEILNALETAMHLSVRNIPRLEGNTAILVDVSGSMNSNLSEYSSVKYVDIASLMGAISHMISDKALVIAFASRADIRKLAPDAGIFQNMDKIQDAHVGQGTYVEEAISVLDRSEFEPDRILLFSDMQCYSQSGDNAIRSINRYLANHGRPYFYSFDLAGYGTSVQPMRKEKVFLFSGWSEKMLNYIALSEKEGLNIIEEIKRNY